MYFSRVNLVNTIKLINIFLFLNQSIFNKNFKWNNNFDKYTQSVLFIYLIKIKNVS